MMGICNSGPLYIYGDNMSVIHDTKSPESTWNAIRESVAKPKSSRGNVKTYEHSTDQATKLVASEDYKITQIDCFLKSPMNIRAQNQKFVNQREMNED